MMIRSINFIRCNFRNDPRSYASSVISAAPFECIEISPRFCASRTRLSNLHVAQCWHRLTPTYSKMTTAAIMAAAEL